jgi:hypothetical protein
MRVRKLLFLSLLIAVGTAGFTMLAPTPAAADYCPMETLKRDAVVRENPDTNSNVLKHKHRGDIITMPCDSRWKGRSRVERDRESGVLFVPVDCECATDGVGWMRDDAFFP